MNLIYLKFIFKSNEWNSFVVSNDGGKELFNIDKSSGLTTIDTLKLKKPIQLAASDSLLSEIAALKAENAKLKADLANLKIVVRTKSNTSQTTNTVTVNCNAGGAALSCANKSNASGDNVRKTTSRGATACICRVASASFGINTIQAVYLSFFSIRKTKLKFVSCFLFLCFFIKQGGCVATCLHVE